MVVLILGHEPHCMLSTTKYVSGGHVTHADMVENSFDLHWPLVTPALFRVEFILAK